MSASGELGQEVKCFRCGLVFWVYNLLRLPFLCDACEDVS